MGLGHLRLRHGAVPLVPRNCGSGSRHFFLDLGVHLTLTSEWEHYRWAPISTVSRASGLIDDDGYLWRDVASLRSNLVPQAAEMELRAQIIRACAAGINPSHIDAHMAAAMVPELLELHVRLGHEYGAVPVLPRRISFAPDPESYSAIVAGLERDGLPIIDHIRGTLPVAAEAVERLPQADRRAASRGHPLRLALHRSGRCRGNHPAARALADQRVRPLRLRCRGRLAPRSGSPRSATARSSASGSRPPRISYRG